MRPWQEIAYLPDGSLGEEAGGQHDGGRHRLHRHDDPGAKHRLPSLFDVADEADANQSDRLDMGEAGAKRVRHGNGLDQVHVGSLGSDPVEKCFPSSVCPLLHFASNSGGNQTLRPVNNRQHGLQTVFGGQAA